MRLDDLQREPGRHRGVERVAAALEHRHPGRRREPVRRGHHAEGAGELRSRREGHPRRDASLARRMTLIDGKAIAQQVRDEVRDEVAAWVAEGHEPPGLATVLVGDDAACAIYVGGKQKASAEVGIRGFDHRLDRDALARRGPRAAARAQRRTRRSTASCCSSRRRRRSTARR